MKDVPEYDHEEQQRLDDLRLRRVIEWSMTIALGGMAGFFAAVRQVNPTIDIRFDWFTLLALIGGGWMGRIFWRVVPREVPGSPKGGKRWLPLLLWLAVQLGAMLFTFGYGMKDLSGPKHNEMLIGAGLAIFALTGVAVLLWRVGKFFEDEHRHYLEQHPEHRDPRTNDRP